MYFSTIYHRLASVNWSVILSVAENIVNIMKQLYVDISPCLWQIYREGHKLHKHYSTKGSPFVNLFQQWEDICPTKENCQVYGWCTT
jgi:hypothetical protein